MEKVQAHEAPLITFYEGEGAKLQLEMNLGDHSSAEMGDVFFLGSQYISIFVSLFKYRAIFRRA